MSTLSIRRRAAVISLLVVSIACFCFLPLTSASRAAETSHAESPMPGMAGVSSRMPGMSGPMSGMSSKMQMTSAQMMGDMNMAGTHYLYVWLGAASRNAPDRLASIDFRRASPDYGKVVGWALVPGPGGIDNEPHHCMIAANMRMIACGGLLSFMRHQPGLFFFDISNPAHPRYLFSRRTTLSAVTDDLRPLPDGGFLVTDMGSSSGGSPGGARQPCRRSRPCGVSRLGGGS